MKSFSLYILLCSYIAFRLTWDADKYIGIPKIQALVEGRKISTYDSGSNETTGVFTYNPAWCLLDYLTNTRYGKGIDIAEIKHSQRNPSTVKRSLPN